MLCYTMYHFTLLVLYFATNISILSVLHYRNLSKICRRQSAIPKSPVLGSIDEDIQLGHWIAASSRHLVLTGCRIWWCLRLVVAWNPSILAPVRGPATVAVPVVPICSRSALPLSPRRPQNGSPDEVHVFSSPSAGGGRRTRSSGSAAWEGLIWPHRQPREKSEWVPAIR